MIIHSPIGWLGSKFKARKMIINQIPPHKKFIDATVGSASVSLNKSRSNKEILSDSDERLIDFYKELKKNYKELAYCISITSFDEDTFDKVRMMDYNPLNFLTLNRMSYLNKGKCFDPTREKFWYKLPGEIIKAGKRLKGVNIVHCDLKEWLGTRDFVWIDPPYLECDKVYLNEMGYNDHVNMLERALRSKAKILLTGYRNVLYDRMLKSWMRTDWIRIMRGKKMIESSWRNY